MGIEVQNSQIKAVSDFLNANPNAVGAMAVDPKAVLAEFGVELDDSTAEALISKLGVREASNIAQAAIIHVDV